MDHITVCICTYRRPNFLRNLLEKLLLLETENLFGYSIVIVDNDIEKSAEETVSSIYEKTSLQINYLIEPTRNISLARNKCIKNASGNYVALIDDDEFPESHWLVNLYKTLKQYNADVVLGPVKPFYVNDPPEWLAKGRFCERPSYKTGMILKEGFRTGNVLLDIKIFTDYGIYFDLNYGASGGEDVEYFERIKKKGYVIIWCDEALVYEYVPVERFTRSYYIRRYIRIGGISGEDARKSLDVFKNILLVWKFTVALVIYIFILPICLFFGQHVLMKYVIKSSHNISWITSFFGWKIIKNKID